MTPAARVQAVARRPRSAAARGGRSAARATQSLVVHEIGSLAKPEWRNRPARDLPVRDADVKAAKDWAAKLGITREAKPLLQLLSKKRDGFTADEKELLTKFAALYAIRLQEVAGIDWVYDGEAHRSEMYHYPITHSEGFEFRGHCRSWDNKYWNKAAVVSRPTSREPFHADEFAEIGGLAEHPVKVPITGAYTLVDWSFDEYYTKKHLVDAGIELGSPESRPARERARREFVVDVAKRIVRPNIEALVDAGAQWVQIDEPAVTTHPEEVPLFVEAFNAATRGFRGRARFSVHICFSDYTKLFPHILGLKDCACYSLELSNRDSWERGTDRGTRTGYHILDAFAEHDAPGAVGLGVVDIHNDRIEPVALVEDRIEYALKVLGGPEKVWPCTDCGLRTRTWDVSFKKLTNLGEAAARVRANL